MVAKVLHCQFANIRSVKRASHFKKCCAIRIFGPWAIWCMPDKCPVLRAVIEGRSGFRQRGKCCPDFDVIGLSDRLRRQGLPEATKTGLHRAPFAILSSIPQARFERFCGACTRYSRFESKSDVQPRSTGTRAADTFSGRAIRGRQKSHILAAPLRCNGMPCPECNETEGGERPKMPAGYASILSAGESRKK